MPITADLQGKNYTLGSGRVLFDRFENNVAITDLTRGLGERYLGNTPEFSTTSESENLDHYDADNGLLTKDDSVQLSLDRTGAMTCDNIDGENVALFFLGQRSIVTQVGATAVAEVFTGALRGRFYQLGVSAGAPSGVRNVSNVVVKKGGAPTWGTTVAATGNYQVDEVRGLVYILATSADIDDEDIQITYDTEDSTREQIISGSDAVYGALRFLANNGKGVNRDYYFPYVKLAPDGDYNLKGEEWQVMGFTFEILKKASNIAAMYVDGQPVLTP